MRGPSPRRSILLGVGLIGLSAALLTLDRAGRAPGPVGRTLSALLSPIQGTATAAGGSVRGVWLDYLALVDVRMENALLEQRLEKLQEAAARSADLVAENERLRKLLELGDRRKDLRLRAARVVSRSTSPFFRVMQIELDVGGTGAEDGMPVIAPGGVVGQIRNRRGDRAEVLLVTDPRSAIDVVMEQSRSRGVAVGTGEQDRYATRLDYVQRAAQLVVGERVLTTGDGGRFPRGLVVGEIEEVGSEGTGPFRLARVRPLVNLSSLDEVFVVLGQSGLTPEGVRFEGEM